MQRNEAGKEMGFSLNGKEAKNSFMRENIIDANKVLNESDSPLQVIDIGLVSRNPFESRVIFRNLKDQPLATGYIQPKTLKSVNSSFVFSINNSLHQAAWSVTPDAARIRMIELDQKKVFQYGNTEFHITAKFEHDGKQLVSKGVNGSAEEATKLALITAYEAFCAKLSPFRV